MKFKGAFVLFPVVLTIILADCVGGGGGAQVKDCGVDMSCFYNAVSACEPAKITAPYEGLSLYLETRQATNQCELFVKVLSGPASATDFINTEMLCPVPSNWANLTFSEDYLGTCRGTLADELKNYLYYHPSTTCSDGTIYGACSSTKPQYCDGGVLINKCTSCGCPASYSCNQTTSACYVPINPQLCSDGTIYGQCSVTKPRYCNNGVLTDSCSACGCPSGLSCNTTSNSCYTPPQTCSDGTVYGQCSTTKPKYCSNGTAINSCLSCGCPTSYSCGSIERTMIIGDSITATDGFSVRLDSVVQASGNVFYAIFTTKNQSGGMETSAQLTNGNSYSFFLNKIRVSVKEVGYNQTTFNGYAIAKVNSSATESLCFMQNETNTYYSFTASADVSGNICNAYRLSNMGNGIIPVGTNFDIYYSNGTGIGAPTGDKFTTASDMPPGGSEYCFVQGSTKLYAGTYLIRSATLNAQDLYSVCNAPPLPTYRYEERILLNNINVNYDESASSAFTGHGLYMSAPYSSGAIEFRLQFIDPIPVGSARNLTEEPIINWLGAEYKLDYKYTTDGYTALMMKDPPGSRFAFWDGGECPGSQGWTVKRVNVTNGSAYGFLNYISLKYGSPTNPPFYSGNVQTGLAQGIILDGPNLELISGTPKYQMKLKGLGSATQTVDSTTVYTSALGSSGTPATHLIQPTWFARDGSRQSIDAVLPDFVAIPVDNVQASFNTNTNTRWMIVNDRVVYLKSVESTGSGTQYNVKLAVGGSTGTEVTVGPFANASGATATFTYTDRANPISCTVRLGSLNTMDLTNVTLYGSGTMSTVDSTTGKCDIYPDLVPIGSDVYMTSGTGVYYIDLRLIQGKSSGMLASKVYIGGQVKNWPVMMVRAPNYGEKVVIIYDSDSSGDGYTGLLMYKDPNSTYGSDGASIYPDTGVQLVYQAKSLVYEDSQYDLTPFGMGIDASIIKYATFWLPETTPNTIFEISKGATLYPVEIPYASSAYHYKTATSSFTITPDVLPAILTKFTTHVMWA